MGQCLFKNIAGQKASIPNALAATRVEKDISLVHR
jgi:hypothetical protein